MQRIWDIDGFPDHFFDELGQLYRITKRGELKLLRRTIKRYTQGYVISSRFYSLHQLRPMLRRHDPATDRPVDF
ncbi:hypothetical protein [Spirosoma rhododendri]|uniref:NUMOD4 domain-containing protein n=1 Tax=Spirosoma rhododendri TaxID=2728024 RepID=A0A7L5DWC2_9BACT|nr:hypothetical protein [Spirosoma rhododendri]QJD80287.1 hypothetical protein HH216_19065 [Spirosoma rhododendri]